MKRSRYPRIRMRLFSFFICWCKLQQQHQASNEMQSCDFVKATHPRNPVRNSSEARHVSRSMSDICPRQLTESRRKTSETPLLRPRRRSTEFDRWRTRPNFNLINRKFARCSTQRQRSSDNRDTRDLRAEWIDLWNYSCCHQPVRAKPVITARRRPWLRG